MSFSRYAVYYYITIDWDPFYSLVTVGLTIEGEKKETVNYSESEAQDRGR